MKKNIAVLLIFLLAFTMLAGCGVTPDEEQQNAQIELEIQKEYDALIAASDDFESMEKFGNYLLKWAAKNDIRASYDENKNVIMSKTPSEGYSNDNSLNIQTPIRLDRLEENCLPVAMSLYLIRTVTENNFMRIIFTNNENNDFEGAAGLSPRYLNAENQITLDWSTNPEKDSAALLLTKGSAGKTVHEMSRLVTYADTTYTQAYQLSIANLAGGSSSILKGKHPNPIKTLGDVLAECKSNGILFELESFQGGTSPDTYPSGATVSLVINDNDINKFKKIVSESQEKFENSYANTEENYVYTLTEMASPDTVLDKASSDSIVSLMYTLVNGTYYKNDDSGDMMGSSNIGQVSIMNKEFKLLICGRTLDPAGENQLHDTFDIIAALTEVNHSLVSQTPIWLEDKESPLIKTVTAISEEKFGVETKFLTTYAETEGTIFSQNTYLGNQLILHVDQEDHLMQTQLLIELLKLKNPAE